VEATEAFSLRKLLISAVALSALGLAAAASPSGADGARRAGSFRASLAPVPHDPAADNGSNASGRASLVLFDDHLTAFVFARGLSPNLPHAMHIHGHEEAVAECPSLARAGEDGLIDTLEGLPDYGGIQVSFTTRGATGGNLLPDGLDLARAPVADRFGFVNYRRTFPIPNDVAERLADKHIVIHGHDLNGNGTYDGELSSLSAVVGAPVPLEAELPVACGPLSGFVRNFR
jgi:hypothetical protein